MDILLLILPIVLVLIIIAIEAIIGYRRGFLCNTFRFILLIIAVLLSLPISAFITDMLVKSSMISDRVDSLLGQIPYQVLAESQMLDSAVSNAFIIVLRPFVYVIVFCVLKLISWGIYLLVIHIYSKTELTQKYDILMKKYPICGLAIGVVYSFIFAAILIMPISSYSNILIEAEKLTKVQQADDGESIVSMSTSASNMKQNILPEDNQGIITRLIGDTTYETIENITENPLHYILRYSGAELVSSTIFRSVSTLNYGGARITANEYILQAAQAGQDIVILTDSLGQKVEERDYTAIIQSTTSLIQLYTESNLLLVSEEDKLDLIRELVDSTKIIQENELLKRLSDQMKYDSIEILEKELDNLVALANTLNSNELIDYFVTSNSSDTQDLISKLDETTIQQVVDELYNMELAQTVVPTLMGILVKELAGEDTIDITYPESFTDFSATKDDFIAICDEAKRIQYLMENTQDFDVLVDGAKLEEDIQTLENTELISSQTSMSLVQILRKRLL